MHSKYRKLINLTGGERNEMMERTREISIVQGTARQKSQERGEGMHQCQNQKNLSLILRRNDRTAGEL
jgi:hypothetical protein